MHRHPSEQDIPGAQRLTEHAVQTLERFLHVEAFSGVVLLVAAAAALIWANSPLAASYIDVWRAPVVIGFGAHAFTEPLHFWINDGLMTVFFLVVGMEIRREIHEGALADLQLAALPVTAALGGVAVPALLYVALNETPPQINGWAVPTATDIAFALGVLALLGRSIPGNVRVLLLALAVIDDLAAVLIIAIFYSGGLDYMGFLVAGVGIVLTFGLQRMGVGSAWAYVLPGAVVWIGMLQTGAHPTLAGVVLGLLTPVRSRPMREPAMEAVTRTTNHVAAVVDDADRGPEDLREPLHALRVAQRELLPPVVRVQMALHPWVAFGVMPLFALANAGVGLGSLDMADGASRSIMLGVLIALALGKPLGVISASWLAVRIGLCRLPPEVNWSGVCLVGLLAGIGFTMSIFIANLAFAQDHLLDAAKLGVLTGSLVAAVLGLTWGWAYAWRLRSLGRGRSEPS